MNRTAFWLALQFLTRLPTPRCLDYSPAALGRSVVMYPWVGLLIGALLLGLDWFLAQAGTSLQAALLLSAWVLISGGLHLDGLADSADAWIGGQGDRERSLAIMKDPNSGPMGVIAIILILLVKYGALVTLLDRSSSLPLLWAPLLARGSIPLLLLSTPYVRQQGLGAALAENLPRPAAAASALLGGSVVLGLAGYRPLLTALFTLWILRKLMLDRLGGCTGDTLGASVEITEAAVLTAAALG